MTALVISTDIPSNINTLEKLIVWSNSCFQALNPTANAIEGDNYTVRAAQAAVYPIATNSTNRFIGRSSIIIGANYAVDSGKLWTFASELSTTALTASMKAN